MFNELAFLITHPDDIFFSVSAGVCLLMVSLLMVSAVLGVGDFGDVSGSDFDAGSVIPSGFADSLSWLGVGKIPMMIWLMIFFGGWSVYGFLIQSFSYELSGDVLTWLIAVPVALIINLPGTALTCKIIMPIIPKNESYAISINDLIGASATIIVGAAKLGTPTQAKVIDKYGSTHYVLIEPEDINDVFLEGEVVAISERNNTIFKGIRLHDIAPQNKFHQG